MHFTDLPVRLFGAEMLADPYPVYHRLRAEDPVHWEEEFQAWVLTRYDDVLAGLHDLRLSSDRSAYIERMVGQEGLQPLFKFLSDRMVLADPPKHTRLRGLVNKAFTPHAVEAMAPHIQEVVDRLLDQAQGQGRMEVVRDLAYPLPITIISEMVGIPVEDRERMKKWSDDFVVYFSNHPASIPVEAYRRAVASVEQLTEYFRKLLAEIRAKPRKDLLTALEQIEEQGDRLTEGELIGNAQLLLVAGHETTTMLIGGGTLALLRHPDQLARLKADPALIPQAVEELLRYVSPVQFTHRLAKEDIALGGKTIRKGQFVYLVLAAANHDPAHFPDPERLDITRAAHKHVAFGQGHHFCVGAPLARLEAQIAFRTMLQRFPNLRLATDKVEYQENFNLHGPRALPVTLQ